MADFISHEAPAHQSKDLPLTLPVRLIGREKSLGQVYTLLKQTKPVLVHGAAGIGKTALAATLASAYCELPGGALWFDVQRSTLAELLARIGRAYAVPELARSENPLSLVGLAMNTLTQHKPLVVLDGAFETNAVTEFIMRCADRVPVLLVTDSDAPLPGPWTSVALPKLDRAASESILHQIAPQVSADGLPELLDALDDVPLALTIAGGAIAASGISPRDFRAAMPVRPGAPTPLLALTAAYSRLSGAQQGLLLLLGAAPRQAATGELLSMVGGAPEQAIAAVMDGLIAARLVERLTRSGVPYYRLHSLTGLFAVSWLRGKGRLEGLQAGMRDALLRYVEKHSIARNDEALIAEMDNLMALASLGAETGARADAERISRALMQAGTFINARGFVQEFMTLRELGIGPSAVFPAHQGTPAPAPFETPIVRSTLEQPPVIAVDEPFDEDEESEDEALVEDDRLTADPDLDLLDDEPEEESSLANPVSVADTLNAFASGEFDDDEFDEDDEDGEFDDDEDSRVLNLIDAADFTDDDEPDDDEEESIAASGTALISQLGGDAFSSDQFEIAAEPVTQTTLFDAPPAPPPPADPLDVLRAELMRARASEDRRGQADVLARIGAEQAARGAQREALASYNEALALYEGLNDKPGQLTTLERLLALEMAIEEYAPAATHAASGARLAREVGDEAIERRMLLLLGDAHVQSGAGEDAARAYSDALDLARTAGDRTEEADLLLKLGFAQIDAGEAQRAAERFEEALTLFRAQSRREREGSALAALGMAHAEMEHWAEAVNFYTSALYIARETRSRRDELERLTNMGFACVQMRDLGQAVMRYRQALHLAFELDDDEEVVAITVELARMLVESKRHIDIAQMLVDAGLHADSSARDLRRLKERIDETRPTIPPDVSIIPVTGTVRDYARNAYALLDQA
jgi:tetratricopeptide (TPR) repeat protein